MTRALLALLVLAAAAPPARAEVMPSGRLSALAGVRTGTRYLDEVFGLGVLYGMEAAWEPLPDGRRLGYALHWNVVFGDFGADPAAITGDLDILEMNLGARLRLAPAADPTRTLFFGGGVGLLRANVPLPPDDTRHYVGGFGGLGVQQLAWRRALITVELRYGLFGGPRSLSVLAGVGFGV
jgi:hypothetical protein